MKKIVLFTCLIFSFSKAQVRIFEVYGAGGNSGAVYNADYVVLYNPSSSSVDISGWALQYASSAGTTTWDRINITAASIPPYAFFLIQTSNTGATGSPLPSPDLSGSSFNMAAANGKVALTSNQTALSGQNPSPTTNLVDFVGYGTANAFEGTSAAPAASTTLAVKRKLNGQDTNINSADFITSAPNPRNLSTGGTLPVNLIHFTGTLDPNRNALLTWATASETNNDRFDIQKSTNALDFETIAFVKGKGDSYDVVDYAFVDALESGKTAYYRLKQVDFNGDFEYSKIIALQKDSEVSIRLYPNPALEEIAISLESGEELTQAAIFDAKGIKMAEHHGTTLNIANLPSGLYSLSGSTTFNRKFSKIFIKP